MVVDDEVGFTNLVKLNLECTGKFEVLTVNRPGEAMAAALSFMPHAMLLDIMMPGIEGGELLQQLQAQDVLKKIPVMFITATPSKHVARTLAADFRCDGIIAKPVDPRLLVQKLDQLI